MKSACAAFFALFFLGFLCLASAKDQRPFVMAASELPGYAHKNGGGIAIRIAVEAFRRIDVPLVIEFFPSNRAKVMLNAGKVDGYLTGTKMLRAKMPEAIMVAEPFAKAEFVALSTNPKIRIGDWADLKRYRVGYVLGSKIFDRLVPKDGTHISKVHTYEDLKKFLLAEKRPSPAGKIILQDRIVAHSQFGDAIGKTIHVVSPPLAITDGHFFIHKSFGDLATRLDIALKAMKTDGTLTKLSR